MTDKTTHKPGCEALGGYGHGIGPCSCSEAQPEALYVAEQLDATRHAFGDDNAQSKRRASAELRRQHAEIQQIKAQNAHLRDALSDIASGEIMRSHCVGPHCTEELGIATADELSSRAAGALNWDDLVAQPSTDVGIPMLAQLSARQAAPNPWQQAIDHELVCLHLGVAEDATQESAAKALRELIQCHVEIAINPQTNGGLTLQPHGAPHPPEREPHPPTRHCMCADCAPSFEQDNAAPGREPLTDEQIAGLDNFVRGTVNGRFARAKAFTQGVERKHGIGAAND